MDAPTVPLWSQKEAIAYEVELEAINDVIAGYSEQIAIEQTHHAPNTARITWLEMRTDQAVSVHHSLNVCDDGNVKQAISEYSAIVRARDRSEVQTTELKTLMRSMYTDFCVNNKKKKKIAIY